ncbi:RING finger protein unkempt homolog isoform X1 [Amphibalanus amphitrite]|uniref:RING finger protein unkempt homolog isoform X1 n=1 Tax=Amphibalanus amphitrite TaxID=1232801 RepID=UPI001C905205|nr:RING finger protein unkempt homolog isoform X1 [Amphibalanus amphitrite]
MRVEGKTAHFSEKSLHLSYLKDFRVDQCPLFQQHKCNQHRPYTCFHWHFKNQRRRRPILRRDGTFNYSPDVYCTKYDESTGECPDGDECPNLHRTAGDTERRYHLRYYKTGMCVHDTDSRGLCVKNGVHCAFAHGQNDMRPPVYDKKEQEMIDHPETDVTGSGPNSLDKERNLMSEDPKWQDTNYVLANYKTEPCKKPPRLCRQGYACPQFHNPRDKRRSPKKYKYRSTPCPNVKQADEWGDPANCEHGDSCQYCHTRTEQQFHPEIYKSTRCNDVQQNGYCPRAAFCAFAHVENEMVSGREVGAPGLTCLADIVSSALPQEEPRKIAEHGDGPAPHKPHRNGRHSLSDLNSGALSGHGKSRTLSGPTSSAAEPLPFHTSPLAVPAGSAAHAGGPAGGGNYPKAPGSERGEKDAQLRRRIHEIDTDPRLDPMEKLRRKNSLFASLGIPLSSSVPAGAAGGRLYGPADPLDSMMGQMSLDPAGDADDGVMAQIDRELEREEREQQALGAALSAPVNIPRAGLGEPLGGLSPSAGSPLLSGLALLGSRAGGSVDQGLLGRSNSMYGSNSLFEYSGSPTKSSLGAIGGQLISQSPLIGNSFGALEVQRLREELSQNRLKLVQWEESLLQARTACEAWQREAEEFKLRAKMAEQARDESQRRLQGLQRDIDAIRSELHGVRPVSDLDSLPVGTLNTLKAQLVADLERIDKAILGQVQAQHQGRGPGGQPRWLQ